MTTSCNHCHASAEFVDDIVHRRDCKLSDAYKLADVSSRLQQLEQEKATTAAIHKQELENFAASWDEQAAMLSAAEDEIIALQAAIAKAEGR